MRREPKKSQKEKKENRTHNSFPLSLSLFLSRSRSYTLCCVWHRFSLKSALISCGCFFEQTAHTYRVFITFNFCSSKKLVLQFSILECIDLSVFYWFQFAAGLLAVFPLDSMTFFYSFAIVSRAKPLNRLKISSEWTTRKQHPIHRSYS